MDTPDGEWGQPTTGQPYFFLSYAHTPPWGSGGGDPDHWVHLLYRDLCNHIMALTDLPAGDLDVPLALRERHDVGLALVQPQLGRLEQAEQRLVVGEDADRPRTRARRDHLDLVVEDLALGGEDLDLEGLVVGH